MMFFRSLQYHKHLCRDIWYDDDHIDRDVRRALIAVVGDFLAYMHSVGIDIAKSDIVDVFVHGSLTNFYYDTHSDIDLCIVANLDKCMAQCGGLNATKVCRVLLRDWRGQFKFDIRGRSIDLSVHDVKNNPFEHGYYRVGSVYSIKKNAWIIRPTRLDDDELSNIKRQARIRVREIKQEIHRCLRNNEPIISLLHNMQVRRTNSMLAQYQQPITPETVAFKMIRNRGWFKKLFKKAQRQRGEQFNAK